MASRRKRGISRPDMTATEVAEFVVAPLAAAGATGLQISEQQPVPLPAPTSSENAGRRQGQRLDISVVVARL
ncbi:MAG: hypothetical protein ACHBNF_08420 [Chromatiales bacterium]